ncbi:hypothetical protein [Blastococcus sp. SYSU D00813]
MTITDPSTALEHADLMQDLFVSVSQACVHMGLRPCGVQVITYMQPPQVRVQLETGDTAAVDALADAFGLPGEADPEWVNYDRQGPAEVHGQPFTLQVFTGRPAPEQVAA